MKSPLLAMLIAAGLALGLSGAAAANSSGETPSSQGSGGAQVTSKIVGAFTDFAGSPENAASLVAGLRSGGEITLTGAGGTGTGGRDAAGKPTATTFTSPTGPMGYGEAYTALALAKDQLAGFGIDNPTPQQIAAALNGGTIDAGNLGTLELQGVLQMRADGMGWGRIAQAQGTKLGWVMKDMESGNVHHSAAHHSSSHHADAQHSEGDHADAQHSESDRGTAHHSDAHDSDGASSTSSDGLTPVVDAGTGGRDAAGKSATSAESSGTTGITNATGENVATSSDPGGAKGKGIVDAGGEAHGNSGTVHAGRGVQSALGANAASGHAYFFGESKSHGVVMATGVGAGAAVAGAGIVNAGSGSPGPVAAASAAPQAQGVGVVSAAGGSNAYQGHGHHHGRGHAYAYGHGSRGR